MAKRLTRHNGRAGKSGVYKSTHNDRTFDTEHAGHIDGERNAKRRHSERDRSVDDLLTDKRFCPEETIYQIGTMEDSVSPDVLLKDEERLYHPKAEEIDYRAGDGD